MQFAPTEIRGIIQITPKVFGDARGFFMETYRQDLFSEAGIPVNFVQENHSSSEQGVLRGLHFQVRQPQGKLIRAISGQVYDVVVDLRRDSPTFGKWAGTVLSADNKRQIWVPQGFAHGFYVLSTRAEVVYKTTDYYAPQWERTLLWNDPALNISWPLISGMAPKLSSKDALGKPLDSLDLLD